MDHSNLEKQLTSNASLHAETARAFLDEVQKTYMTKDLNNGCFGTRANSNEVGTIDFSKDQLLPPKHEVPPIIERMEGAAIGAIGKNIEGLVGMAKHLPDGELSPRKILHLAHELGMKIDPKTAEFLQNFPSISKHTDSYGQAQFTMHGDHGFEFPMHKEVGPGNVDSLKTDRDISFTLGKRDGHPVIENLKGISVDTDVLGLHLNAPITELAVRNDTHGVKIEAVAEPHNLFGSHKVPVEILIGTDRKVHAGLGDDRSVPPPPPNPIGLLKHLAHKIASY
jgi:hypothetical protein